MPCRVFCWRGSRSTGPSRAGGLEGELLLAAALRCLRVTDDVGGVVMAIEAKNERAARWYVGYGAEPLEDRPLTLVAPLRLFAEALRAAGRL